MLFAGPIGSVLATMFGNRVVVMAGGLIAVTAMFFTMFMEATVGIILSWGVVTGLYPIYV